MPIDLPNEIDIGCLPEPSVDQAIIGFLKNMMSMSNQDQLVNGMVGILYQL